jgi:integrase
MKNERGMGRIFQPTYVDPKTGEIKTAATWRIKYYVNGKCYRESAGCDRKDAVKLLKRRIAEAGSGRPFGADVEKTTLGDMVEMVKNDYKANGLRLRAVVAPLAHLLGYFGKDCRAMDISSDRVTAYIAARQEQKAANATINRSLAALKRGFTLAERAGKVARRPHVGMLGESNRRKGFFEADQFEALKAELPAYLEALVETAYITGWRIASELTTRRRQDPDLKAGWLRLDPDESKNDEGRNFPLTPRLLEVLAAQVEQTRAFEVENGRVVPWLFHREGEPIGSFRKTWIAVCKRAGLAGRIPHDFRRTAVRNLERAGSRGRPRWRWSATRRRAFIRGTQSPTTRR